MPQDSLIAANDASCSVYSLRMLLHLVESPPVSPDGRCPHTGFLVIDGPSTKIYAAGRDGKELDPAISQTEIFCLLSQQRDQTGSILPPAEDDRVVDIPCHAPAMKLGHDEAVELIEVEIAQSLTRHGSDADPSLHAWQIGIDATLQQPDCSRALVFMPYFFHQFLLDDHLVVMMEVGLDDIIIFRVTVKVTPDLLVRLERATLLDRAKGAVGEQPCELEGIDERLKDDLCLDVDDMDFAPFALGEEHERAPLVWSPRAGHQLIRQLADVVIDMLAVCDHVLALVFSVAT